MQNDFYLFPLCWYSVAFYSIISLNFVSNWRSNEQACKLSQCQVCLLQKVYMIVPKQVNSHRVRIFCKNSIMAALLVCYTYHVRVELLSYTKTFFYSNKFAWFLDTWVHKLCNMNASKEEKKWGMKRLQFHLGFVISLFVFNSLRAFSLAWPAAAQIYWKKRKCSHEKRLQLPKDWFGTWTKMDAVSLFCCPAQSHI